MNNSLQLVDVLVPYVSRSGYTAGQLARLTGIPKATIVNWLEGRVQRPRELNDLLRLAAVLHLDESEASLLLQSVGRPAIAELEALARQNADGDMLALLTPWAQSNSAQPTPAPFQVMADLPYFVGREEELQALQKALAVGEHATIYSIQGMGGVGKTALAIRVAYELRAHFVDGILWARVDTSDTMSILSTFASAYGLDVSRYVDVDSRSRVVRELLADKRALIVLDNAQSSEQVKPLLPPTGTCAVIVTTRRHDLSVTRGAHRFLIGPFDAAKEESLVLFARVLGEARVAKERELLLELAELLGHLPLAVDIAAGRLAYEPGWSTVDFLQRVRQEKRRLGELAYEDQSVRLSLNASYEVLTPAQQRFFAALGTFEGDDFSDEAAAFVTGSTVEEAQDYLRQLYGLSLVQQGRRQSPGQPSRYRLHPLIRDYAREHLRDEQAWTRLVDYFIHYAERNIRNYSALDLEMKNVLTALRLAAAEELHGKVVRGIAAFYPFLEARGLYVLAAEYLALTERAATRLNEPAALLTVRHNLGRLAQRQGEYIEAEAQYEEALALAREGGDQEKLSHLLRALGVLAARRGDYGLADAYYKEGLSLARELGHGGIVSNFLRGLGVQAYIRGDFARAEAFYEEGLALMALSDEEAQEAEGVGGMLWGLGALAQEQGDIDQAESYYKESLALARQLGHQERIIVLLRSLGGLAVVRGDDTQAEAYYEEALGLARAIGHRWQIGRVLSEMGELQVAQSETDAAMTSFRELFELARILHSQELVAVALYGLARAAALEGELIRAREYAEESLDTFIAIGHYKVHEIKEWLAELAESAVNG
ncbi:MAG TPA: tetratricopeptide repeat protein [Anaerolineae bacterium]